MNKVNIEVNIEDKYWSNIKGELHRDDGPAIEFDNGTKIWYKEGKLHRKDGSAIVYSNGDIYWYYEGEQIFCSSTEEFIKLTINYIPKK